MSTTAYFHGSTLASQEHEHHEHTSITAQLLHANEHSAGQPHVQAKPQPPFLQCARVPCGEGSVQPAVRCCGEGSVQPAVHCCGEGSVQPAVRCCGEDSVQPAVRCCGEDSVQPAVRQALFSWQCIAMRAPPRPSGCTCCTLIGSRHCMRAVQEELPVSAAAAPAGSDSSRSPFSQR